MGIKLNLRKVNTAWVNVFEREKDRENMMAPSLKASTARL